MIRIKIKGDKKMVALYVLLGFILFAVIYVFILLAEKKLHPAFIKLYDLNEFIVSDKLEVKIPVDTLVSTGHTWARPLKGGDMKIGIDEFALKSLGRLQIKNIVAKGDLVKQGTKIMEAKIGGNTINFHSPVDGVVHKLNPSILNKNISDPYGEDWGVIIYPINFERNKKVFKINEELVEWMKNELNRLKNYISINLSQPQLAGQTMYDGGKLIESIAGHLSQDKLNQFEKEFLTIYEE